MRNNLRSTVVLFVCAMLLAAGAPAQQFEFLPGAQYDPTIPTLEKVVGHAWGAQITMHHEAERYLHALADASPRVRLVRFGETWEGKSLYYLVISSEANLARIGEIQAGMKRLADPRRTPRADAERLIGSIVPVTWLTYGVHGNEISSPDAALLTAYHLAAALNDAVVSEILEKSVVIIDPMQNPDGRDRFINYFRQTAGRWPDADPQAAEHNEVWPAGRFNHYLFDMNRDWFAGTQKESRARVAAYQEWFPVVFVDLHEMGGNSTYYFAPPADPVNPNVPEAQQKWWERYGRNNAAWFDRHRIDYFTRDVFDSFYPGYGEGWPLFHGSIGMTYEQASTRGLVFERRDKSVLHYRETVRNHFLTSLATAETTAKNARDLLQYFYDYRRTAVEEGQRETIKEYILPPGRDPNRTAKLAARLIAQGIEVRQAEAAFTNPRAQDFFTGATSSREFPAGTYVVSLAQPAKRLAKTLLDRHTPMDDEFVAEQIRRRERRQGDQIYDVTAWSLPLIYDVECYPAEQASQGRFRTLSEAPRPAGRVSGRAHLHYLIRWGTNSAAAALADLHRQGVKVWATSQPFRINNTDFPRGSLIIKVAENGEDVHAMMEEAASNHGVEIHSTDHAWVESGQNLGSNYVFPLAVPRIALAWNMPTNPMSAGWTRYVLEQMYGLPVTLLHTMQIPFLDLSRYNVLILPNASGIGGGYPGLLGENGARRLRAWLEQGGTLITFGAATRWLTEEKVGLLASEREMQTPEKKEGKPEGFDYEAFIQPDREPYPPIAGAIFRVTVDDEHFLGYGYPGRAFVMVSGNNVMLPLKLDKGRNVAVYVAGEEGLVAGFAWAETHKALGGKAYLMHTSVGRGNVVAFSEEPTFRAFMDGLNLLVLNGVFFGPNP